MWVWAWLPYCKDLWSSPVAVWPVLLRGISCWHLELYIYMLIFSHTREPVLCNFLQYGYFSFDECFPWGLTISSACTHLRNPRWQEHTHGENIFTGPEAVAIINHLLFYHSSIWELFSGPEFLQSFVWLDGHRAPLGIWPCWNTPSAFKEIRMGPNEGQQVPGLRNAHKPPTPRIDIGQG